MATEAQPLVSDYFHTVLKDVHNYTVLSKSYGIFKSVYCFDVLDNFACKCQLYE